MSLNIPTDPAHFTTEWLSAALRGSGTTHVADVVAVGPSSLGEGFGLLGSLARLSLGYDRHEAGLPGSLVAKFPATAEANRTLARQYRVYEREARFYREVAPTIGTRLPRAYAVELDTTTGDAAILLEDLTAGTFGDQLVPPGDAEVTAALGEVASLHAAWWGRAGTPSVTWVPELRDPLWLQVGASFEIFWPAFQANFPDLISPAIRRIGDRFAGAVASIAERLCRPPITLLHGDYRLDNLFFGRDGLTVIDWQLISRGRAPYDVAYFLSQSMDPARRSAGERDILQRYHESLREGGVSGYSLEECWEDYRLATLWCLMYPVAAGGGLDLSNERGVALARAMATRSFAAIEHLGAGTLLDG